MPRFFRRGRKPPTADASEATPANAAGRDWASALIVRLEAVAAEAAHPEEALEPALRMLLEAVGVEAGALCLFDGRRQLLRLAAEMGLSDEGCRWVRTIRRGDPTTWEMPLHGLLNRRAYLIESADQNRYVPKLIEETTPMRTVACVPFYGSFDGLGVVVLISTGARALVERDIVALVRPLETLAKMVEAVRQQVHEEGEEPAVRPPAIHHQIDIVALNAERAALRAERDELRAVLAEGSDERGQLARELAAITAERDGRQVALDAALAEREALEEEIERLRSRVGRVANLETQITELQTQLDRQGASRSAAETTQTEQLERIATLERSRADLARRADALAGDLERARASAREEIAATERRVAEQEAEIGRLSKRLEEAAASGQHERAADDQHEGERLRLAGDLDAALQREQRLRDEAAAATAEHRRAIEAALDTARAAESARVAADAELESARARLRDATRASDTSGARAVAAERERDRMGAELALTVARVTELKRELDQADASRAGSRDAEFARAIEAAHAAEAGRAAAAAEVAAQGAQLAAAMAELRNSRERLGAVDQDVERLASELRESAVREQRLREEIVAGEARHLTTNSDALTQAQNACRAAEAAREQAEHGAAALRATLAVAEAERAKAVLAAGTATEKLERHLRDTEAARSERGRIEAALSEALGTNEALRARLTADTQELGELRQLHDRLQASDHSRGAEEAALRRQLEQIARERDLLRATLGTAEVERDRARSELAATEAARTRLESALGRETLERARLTAVLAERGPASLEPATATGKPVAALPAAPAPAPRPVPVRVTQLRASAAEGGSTSNTIVVIDADETWSAVRIEGREIVRLAPNAEAAAELETIDPERIVVNIACPDALGSMLAARAHGLKQRFWGCISAPGGERVLPLGMIEAASHPIDPEILVEVLKGYVGRGSRVVTAGADVDGLMSLRQALARCGVGVNMAWDAKQVGDLLPVVRPVAVAVDLDLPRWDGFGIIATLAQVDPIPHALLVGGMEDASKAFAGLLAEPRHQGRAVARDQILKGALSRSEHPTQTTRVAEATMKAGHRAASNRRQAAGA